MPDDVHVFQSAPVDHEIAALRQHATGRQRHMRSHRWIDGCTHESSGGGVTEGRVRRKNGGQQLQPLPHIDCVVHARGEVVTEPDVPMTAEPAA